MYIKECWENCDWENGECPEHCRGDRGDGSCRENMWAAEDDGNGKCGDLMPYESGDERLDTIGNDGDSCCGPPNCVAHCVWADNCPTDCDTSKCAEDGVFPKGTVDAFIAGGCNCSNKNTKTSGSLPHECLCGDDGEDTDGSCREHMWAKEGDGTVSAATCAQREKRRASECDR